MNAERSKLEELLPRLRRFVRGLIESEDDAEDIVQDTVYQYLRSLGESLAPISNLSAWLCRVARNLTLNKAKKHTEERLYFSADEDDEPMRNIADLMADDGGSPEDDYLREVFWQTFTKALEELPAEQRIAFELTELDDLSTKEAAEFLGVSQNTFLSRKHYAVLHLRKRLSEIYREIMEKD